MKRYLLLGIVAAAAVSLSPANAADIAAKGPIFTKAAVAAPVFSWQRCYVGAHVGYGWGRTDWDDFSMTWNTSGVVAGGQAGCNWQPQGNFVFGIEGEVWWSDIKGTGLFVLQNATDTLTTRNRWDADIALRFGIAADRALFYVKGGGAYGNFHYTDVNVVPNSPTLTMTGTADKFGWLVGAGVEYALDYNWSVKVEYNYIDFGRKVVTMTGPNAVYTTGNLDTKHIVKVGVNYLFGGPLVAKY